jgi:glycosyltransferase involved in cell wall biosynthesis
MACVHRPIQRLVYRRFRELYKRADAVSCVCLGMRETLGPIPKAQVLFPTPATMVPGPVTATHSPAFFKILYSGNLGEYSPMLGEMLEVSLEDPGILIQVRGNNPDWSEVRKAKMRENGRWFDFTPRHELDAWLASADAFLIPMVFDPSIRRRMETSFPYKLIEFAQFGKPLIIWGPDYCSAIRWAREGDKALCVTEPAPCVVLVALKELSSDTTQLKYFTECAAVAANAEFSPKRIQAQFMKALQATVGADFPTVGGGARRPEY